MISQGRLEKLRKAGGKVLASLIEGTTSLDGKVRLCLLSTSYPQAV